LSQCGFDSIPSDIGTLLLADFIKEKHNVSLEKVRATVYNMCGTFSGGTFLSMLEIMSLGLSNIKKAMSPYYLVFGDVPRPDNPLFTPKVYYDKDFGRVQGSHPLGTANEQIVRRSASLLNYGPEFRFRETSSFRYRITAYAASFLFSMATFLLLWSPFRSMMRRFGPKSGSGPSLEERENGFFEYRLIAEAQQDDNVLTAKSRVYGHGDPGYKMTAVMVAEAALCAALDRDQCPGRGGGVLTPASAFGKVLVQRLRHAGMELQVGEEIW